MNDPTYVKNIESNKDSVPVVSGLVRGVVGKYTM